MSIIDSEAAFERKCKELRNGDELFNGLDRLGIKDFTREALLSEAGFEKLFRTQNWVRRSKLFCR